MKQDSRLGRRFWLRRFPFVIVTSTCVAVLILIFTRRNGFGAQVGGAVALAVSTGLAAWLWPQQGSGAKGEESIEPQASADGN